jgi:hypothetical protein
MVIISEDVEKSNQLISLYKEKYPHDDSINKVVEDAKNIVAKYNENNSKIKKTENTSPETQIDESTEHNNNQAEINEDLIVDNFEEPSENLSEESIDEDALDNSQIISEQ